MLEVIAGPPLSLVPYVSVHRPLDQFAQGEMFQLGHSPCPRVDVSTDAKPYVRARPARTWMLYVL
jgi:hypothetical protein